MRLRKSFGYRQMQQWYITMGSQQIAVKPTPAAHTPPAMVNNPQHTATMASARMGKMHARHRKKRLRWPAVPSENCMPGQPSTFNLDHAKEREDVVPTAGNTMATPRTRTFQSGHRRQRTPAPLWRRNQDEESHRREHALACHIARSHNKVSYVPQR